jgi:hypothetical protein
MYNNTKDNMFYFNLANNLYRQAFDPLTKRYIFINSTYIDVLDRLNIDGYTTDGENRQYKETELVGYSI